MIFSHHTGKLKSIKLFLTVISLEYFFAGYAETFFSSHLSSHLYKNDTMC